jgi:plastocyanin
VEVNSRQRLACVVRRAALISFLLLGGLYASAATAAVSVGGPGGQPTFTDSSSLSSTTTINAGDTVVWTWQSGLHSTTSGTCTVTGNCTHTGFWDSGVFAFSSSSPPTFSRTFNKPGIYPYFCTVHDNAMTGVVVVRPNFVSAKRYATGNIPLAVALADVNGDGKLDAITVNNGNNMVSGVGSVSVLLGNGDGTFGTKTDFPVGANPAGVAVGDFDGDGKPDLAVSNVTDGTVSILRGNGDGTFQTAVPYTVGGNAQSIAIADFNGDGKLDIVVANSGGSNVSILLGNGTGTFQPAMSVSVGTQPLSVVVADFNRDGIPDLAVSNSMDGTISILLGKGDGTFQTPQTFAAGGAGSRPKQIAVGDLNGDGILDLAVADDGPTPKVVSVFLGKGDGSFQPPVSYPVGAANANPQSLALLDINGDGNLDIAVADSASANVHILMGDGKGGFQAAGDLSISPDTGSQFIVAGDMDRDGKPDLVTADFGQNNISVLLNRTPFVPAVPGPATHLAVTSPTTVTAGAPFSVAVTAFDDFERVATGYTGSIAFSSSDGTATLPANYTFTSGAGLNNGTHTFNGVILRSAGQLQTIAAADTVMATIGGSSSDITVVPGPAAPMVVTAPATVTAGAAFSFNVTVYDQFGNIATNYAGTVRFSSSDPSASLPSNSTLTNGVGNFNATLLTGGIQTLTATDTLNNLLTGSASVLVLPVPTTITLVVAPDQSAFRQTVKLSATIASVAFGPPVGTVVFFDGARQLNPAPVSCLTSGPLACRATLTSSRWTIGAHTLTASFSSGSPNFQNSPLSNPVINYHAPKPIQRGP